jgi:UDP-glucose 4-epimerase
VQFGPIVHGDLRNREEVDQLFRQYKPIAVMHFAALSQDGESVNNPGLYWKNNVLGSLNLI